MSLVEPNDLRLTVGGRSLLFKSARSSRRLASGGSHGTAVGSIWLFGDLLHQPLVRAAQLLDLLVAQKPRRVIVRFHDNSPELTSGNCKPSRVAREREWARWNIDGRTGQGLYDRVPHAIGECTQNPWAYMRKDRPHPLSLPGAQISVRDCALFRGVLQTQVDKRRQRVGTRLVAKNRGTQLCPARLPMISPSRSSSIQDQGSLGSRFGAAGR
jgi:hypothetical protein